MVSRYLVSTDGYLNMLISNSDCIYYCIESESDIHKVIQSWLKQWDYRLNDKVKVEIDYPLRKIKFSYHMFDDDDYPMEAEWTLIEITKP